MAKPNSRVSVPRTCRQCTAGFLAQRNQVASGGGNFCSMACYHAHRKAVWEASNARSCGTCGANFFPRRGDSFCSPACYHASRRGKLKPRAPRTLTKCAECSADMALVPWQARAGAKFCSYACYWKNKPRSMEERFWSHVDKDGPMPTHAPHLGACWMWTIHVSGRWASSYGVIGVARRDALLAHRASWIIHHGAIHDDAFVLHHCDTPPCVNPAHLFIGDHAANMADKVRKGRQAKGPRSGAMAKPDAALRAKRRRSAHYNAKLTEKAVASIRARYAAGGVLMRELATERGVSVPTIHNAIHGKRWAHVPNSHR